MTALHKTWYELLDISRGFSELICDKLKGAYFIKDSTKNSTLPFYFLSFFDSRAQIFTSMGDLTMAIMNFTQTVKLDPQDHEAFFKRAELYEAVSYIF